MLWDPWFSLELSISLSHFYPPFLQGWHTWLSVIPSYHLNSSIVMLLWNRLAYTHQVSFMTEWSLESKPFQSDTVTTFPFLLIHIILLIHWYSQIFGSCGDWTEFVLSKKNSDKSNWSEIVFFLQNPASHGGRGRVQQHWMLTKTAFCIVAISSHRHLKN